MQCSKVCNGGIQTRTVYCTSHHRGQVIDDKYCAHLTKESLERACNTQECPKWQYGDESAVSLLTRIKSKRSDCLPAKFVLLFSDFRFYTHETLSSDAYN